MTEIDTQALREDFAAALAGMSGPEDWTTMEFTTGAVEEIIVLCDVLDAVVAALRAERADVLYLIDAIRDGWVVLSGERGEFYIATLRYLDIRARHAEGQP